MRTIGQDKSFNATIAVPESLPDDTVTYTIYRASDGAVFQSGNATYAAGIQWNVVFTPNSADIFIVEVFNSRLDVRHSRAYKTTSRAKVGESFTVVFAIPESASGNTVTYKVIRPDGTIFALGNAVFVAGIYWKVTLTPTAVGTYKVEANNTTLEVIYDQEVIAEAAVAANAVPTTQEMLDNVRRAINDKLTGGGVQSYSISGRSVQNYSLKELRDLEESLMYRLATECGGTTNYARFADA